MLLTIIFAVLAFIVIFAVLAFIVIGAFAVLAFIVIGAFAAQMKRRRDYENSESDEV